MRHVILGACIIGAFAWTCSPSNGQQNAKPESPPFRLGIAGTQYHDYIIGNSMSYENLSIFPISSKAPRTGDRYTTLDEGLAAGTVKVIEIVRKKQRR